MYMPRQFIPLGYHCNITFLSQDMHIKHETGLFEWIQTNKLQYITDIVNHIKDTIDINIIHGQDKNIYIFHREVFTYHYTLDDYQSIFVRRATRFIDLIQKSDELLFVRINPVGQCTTEEEINHFCNAIHSIHPALHIKFLIIHTIHTYNDYKKLDASKISNITFIQKEFMADDCPDEYLKNNTKIQEQFANYLQECGIDIESKSYIQFSDTS